MVLQNTLTIAVGLGNLNEVWVSQVKMNIFYHTTSEFMFKLMSMQNLFWQLRRHQSTRHIFA